MHCLRWNKSVWYSPTCALLLSLDLDIGSVSKTFKLSLELSQVRQEWQFYHPTTEVVQDPQPSSNKVTSANGTIQQKNEIICQWDRSAGRPERPETNNLDTNQVQPQPQHDYASAHQIHNSPITRNYYQILTELFGVNISRTPNLFTLLHGLAILSYTDQMLNEL